MTVALGYIHDEYVNARWMASVMRLIKQREIATSLYCESGGGNLDKGRNLVVQKFLQTEGVDKLLFVDTDMFFQVEDFDQLMKTGENHPIVSGLYFANERPPRAAMYRWNEEGRAVSVSEWEDHEVIEVDGVGAGFLLVDRSVYEAMDHPDLYQGRAGSWFNQNALSPRGWLLNEDSSFCVRAQEHGYKVMVDTDAFIGHIKPRVLGFE